jgi:hypothetical protein
MHPPVQSQFDDTRRFPANIRVLCRLPDERMNGRSRSRTPAVSAAPSGDDGDSDAEAAAQHESEQQRQGAELDHSHPQQQQQQQQTSRLWQVSGPPLAPQVCGINVHLLHKCAIAGSCFHNGTPLYKCSMVPAVRVLGRSSESRLLVLMTLACKSPWVAEWCTSCFAP